MRDAIVVRALAVPEGAIGAIMLLVIAALGFAAPWLAPGDPLDIVARPLLPALSDPAHILGSDRLGRDIVAILLHGARSSLVTGLAVAITAIGLGAAIGTLAGYFGGVVDDVLMRLADAVQTVPSFLLALAIVAVAGPSTLTVVLALAASAWTGPARVVRAEVRSVRQRAYVDASRLIGRHPLAIAFTVVLPNAFSTALALATVLVGGALLAESALAFLGLGDPNFASWGALIAEGRAVLRTAPHVILAPGLALFFTVLAVSFLGEGLAKALAGRTE